MLDSVERMAVEISVKKHSTSGLDVVFKNHAGVPHTYGHLVFDKRAKTMQWKKIAFSTNGAGSTGG